jgi:hypothetical protein
MKQKPPLVINPDNRESVLGGMERLLSKRKFREARLVLSNIKKFVSKSVEEDAPSCDEEKWFNPLLLLISKGYFSEASWLLGFFEKTLGSTPIVHFGNPMHKSLHATEGTQRWEEFFDKAMAPEEVIDEVFDKSITTEHKAKVDAWRANNLAPNSITFGSCFARAIANAFLDMGYKSETLHLEESVNTPKAILEIFNLIQTGTGNEFLKGKIQGRETVILNILKAANIIVTTLGVGFYYVDRDEQLYIGPDFAKKIKSGEIRPVFPPVAEHIETINKIHEKLLEFNPGALKIITLSPVPLSGYFGEPGMFIADCVSKSALRSAIFHAIDKTSFVYLPTFEALKWISPHMSKESSYQPFVDPRHPNRFLVAAILRYLLPRQQEK